jgi:penicillin-binding protein 1A
MGPGDGVSRPQAQDAPAPKGGSALSRAWSHCSTAVRTWVRPDPTKRPRIGRAIVAAMLAAAAGATAVVAFVVMPSLYLDRRNLPDLGPFMRFEFPAIGTIYDAQDKPLIELAVEKRVITQYEEIPPIVLEAILAAEDKRFFSHNGVDYYSLPRVVSKIRLRHEEMFPQGGSTITQQLVRGVFLQNLTSKENSDTLQSRALTPRLLSTVLGARQVNRFLRKHEEMRLSLWLERKMQQETGSKLAAKKEILARYASFVYMGQGQYGFAKASEYYFGRPLSSLTAEDADLAAVLAGIMKAPRDYAPSERGSEAVLRRRNLILGLMEARGAITQEQMARCRQKAVGGVAQRAAPKPVNSAAVVQHILDEFESTHPELSLEDLMQGRINVFSTVDDRIQRIASEALERGLASYEKRHPKARGIVQGAVVVLKNGDGSILAEVGGRQVYADKSANYLDFNRVTQSMRQPGSAMKPIVYLAAFRRGDFSLDTIVPDEPISVMNAHAGDDKWISNYDGQFKGMIPLRKAFAESRNTVAVWMASQIGIDSVLYTARSLGVHTPLKRYPTTALGASEMSLLELATAYRTMASGILVQPHVVRRVIDRTGDVIGGYQVHTPPRTVVNDGALVMLQEALRGVVKLPSGTAHALSTTKSFPLQVMGKTGTTSDFKDAVFVGSTYGPEGITVAVRIGFDDNRTLGRQESGGRVALPVFQDIMRRVYADKLVGPPPPFPQEIERSISHYLQASRVAALLPNTFSLITIGR